MYIESGQFQDCEYNGIKMGRWAEQAQDLIDYVSHGI
jgi:hypothetical protein